MSSTDQNVAEVRKSLTTADRETAQAILDAERTRPEGVRTTVIMAASERLERLDAEEVEAAAAPVTPEETVERADTPPAPVKPADEAPAQAAKPAKVKPATYDDPSWAVGQYAPGPVVRTLDLRTGRYGEPRTGDLKPGEAGDYVVQSGDTITPYIRTLLG